MKKTLAIIFLLALIPTCAFAAAPLSVTNQNFGAVTVYTVSSASGANAVVVENEKLVVFDAFGDKETDAAYKKFIDSLGKPVERVVLSHDHDHHWQGVIALFPGAKLYSTDADAINAAAGGALNVTPLAGGKQIFDGVAYEFESYPALEAWVIKMPAQKVAMAHHLGYAGLFFPAPPLNARLEILKDLEREGYAWYIGGHGKAPVDAGFVTEIEQFFNVVEQAAAASKDPRDAKAAIMAKYPQWAGDFLLDALLPLLY